MAKSGIQMGERRAQGIVQMNPGGYGFVQRFDGEDSVFIPPTRLSTALDGDQVEITFWPSEKGFEGRIVEILERQRTRIVGVLEKTGRRAWRLSPEDPRILRDVEVTGGPAAGVVGELVVGEIVSYPEKRRDAIWVTVERSLGEPERLETQVAKILVEAGIDETFPEDVIGPKSAERIGYFLVRRSAEDTKELARAILAAVEGLGSCSVCGHVSETDPCPICADETREPGTVCVVESSRDLEALEATGEYRGRYHVLGGRVAPAEGVGLEDLNLSRLMDRLEHEGIEEVVIATNPTFEGEATAAMLARVLGEREVKVTRIARGIPSGGEIVHMNAAVLGDALRGRASFD